MPAKSHPKRGNEDRNGCDRRGGSGSVWLRDDEDQAEQPAGGRRFARDERTVTDAFSREGSGMDEIERAAKEVGLSRARAPRKGLQPEIDDQYRADQQRTERNLQIARPQPVEGRSVMLPALEQHPGEDGGHDIGELEEYLPQQPQMRVCIIGEDAAYLTRARARKTLLRQEKHVRDGEIDSWENREEAKQYPPETEEADEGITRGTRPQNLGEPVFAIETVEIYDQDGFPAKDRVAPKGG